MMYCLYSKRISAIYEIGAISYIADAFEMRENITYMLVVEGVHKLFDASL